MIQPWQSSDLRPLLAVWRESTEYGHPFINADYWQENERLVRDVYLPASRTWVWQADGEIKGFISVMEPCVVGALFVAPQAIGCGIGRALLAHVCQRYSDLTLEVYQQNTRAVHFYHARGFRIEDCAWQDDTGQPTWLMRWQADQTP